MHGRPRSRMVLPVPAVVGDKLHCAMVLADAPCSAEQEDGAEASAQGAPAAAVGQEAGVRAGTPAADLSPAVVAIGRAMEQARSAPSPQAMAARRELRERYESEGFAAPLYALGPKDVASALSGFKRFEEEHFPTVEEGSATSMNHVWLPWLRDLARHPLIVSAVQEVFCTKNVYLYNSQLLARAPGKSQQTAMGVGWHKDADSVFSRLSPVDRRHWVTAFVALSMCDRDHGCLRVRPTQRGGLVSAELVPVDLELLPGEFSLHGPSTVHTGGLNSSDETRCCVALRYIRASTRDTHADVLGRDMVLPVSGKGKGHFDLIPEVEGEATEDGRKLRADILRRRRMGPSAHSVDGMVCA